MLAKPRMIPVAAKASCRPLAKGRRESNMHRAAPAVAALATTTAPPRPERRSLRNPRLNERNRNARIPVRITTSAPPALSTFEIPRNALLAAG
jgi:hypothetical protein